MKLWVCTTKEFLHKLSETVSGKLICVLVFTRVLTWLQVSTRRVVCWCQRFEQSAQSWQWGMGRHKLRATQLHFINGNLNTQRYRCRDIHPPPSCFSMIMHGPMSQGSVYNSCKLKMSQFFHGLHTHQTCHPLSMFGMLWIDLYDSVFQFTPISSNFTQPLKTGTTFHRPQSTA